MVLEKSGDGFGRSSLEVADVAVGMKHQVVVTEQLGCGKLLVCRYQCLQADVAERFLDEFPRLLHHGGEFLVGGLHDAVQFAGPVLRKLQDDGSQLAAGRLVYCGLAKTKETALDLNTVVTHDLKMVLPISAVRISLL